MAGDSSKVLIVSPNFYPSAGGVESHLIELIRTFSDVEFSVLANWRPDAGRAAELFPNVEFHYVWPYDRSLRKWLASSKATVGLYRAARATFELLRLMNRRRWLRELAADIVHFHFLDLDQASRLARRLGAPVAIRDWFKMSVGRIGSRAGLLLTDHTVFTSPSEIVPDEAKTALLATFKNIISVDSKSFEVVKAYQRNHPGNSWFIPNSVNTDLFRPSRHAGKKFRVGFAGRAGKSGEDLLKIVIRELGPRVSWRVALAGEANDVRRGVGTRGGADVELFHNLDYLGMPEFYAGIDILFNPFPGEGIGRTSLEAMACGVPVLAVGQGDKYPIRNGETGYVLPPNPKVIAEMIRRLQKDAELIKAMGGMARAAVEREFSNSAVLPNVRAVYTQLASDVTA